MPLDVGLCERCNPLGLRDASSSQVHGIAIAGVILFVVFLAIAGRFVLAGIGPFAGSVTGVVPDGSGLAITLSVTNHGTSAGQTTCRVTDPADRTGNLGAFLLSPSVDGGKTVVVHRTHHGAGPDRSAAGGRMQRAVTAIRTDDDGRASGRRLADGVAPTSSPSRSTSPIGPGPS